MKELVKILAENNEWRRKGGMRKQKASLSITTLGVALY
jgi:hypothetical protein